VKTASSAIAINVMRRNSTKRQRCVLRANAKALNRV
jgi:hypothetical protein